MAANLYRGFSTKIFDGVQTGVYDVMLVKQDLLNVFNTPIRSRVGRGRWGSIIPLLLFDLGHPDTDRRISQDVDRIIRSDPRISLIEKIINVDLDGHSVLLNLKLNYIELGIQEWTNVSVTLDR